MQEKKQNCKLLTDLCSTVEILDNSLANERSDRLDANLQLQSGFDGKLMQLRNEMVQEIETINNKITTDVNNAIATVVADAPENLDTLKETADWISTHGIEAAELNSAIVELQNSLDAEAADRVKGDTAAKNLANATGTLAVANGGTGYTTANGACNSFLNALTTGSSTPTSADYFISQYAGGGTATNTFHRRPVYALWAYIKGEILSTFFPVGIIITTTSSTSPGNTYGGTWTQIAQGRTLIGAGKGTDSNSTEKEFTVNGTGGEYTHTLSKAEMPAHSHTFTGSAGTTVSGGSHTHGFTPSGSIANGGSHTHTFLLASTSTTANNQYAMTGDKNNRGSGTTDSGGSHSHSFTGSAGTTGSGGSHSHNFTPSGTNSDTGSGTSHNIVQPYLVVYFWKRTA